MKINKLFFYENVKTPVTGLFNYLSKKQTSGFETIFDFWESSNLSDMRWLAYMLATVYHETGRTMQPIEEWGKGRKHSYGQPDAVTGKVYYGRGLVQLTWKKNYEKLGQLLKVDLVNCPELACDPKVAVQIMYIGMEQGLFTGKCLKDFFNDVDICDWYNARKIINGVDKAADIARYAHEFLKSISTI